MRPHRRQPTRLPCPWDSPGKNTGVGCHFLLQCMKVKSESQIAELCLTLCDPMDCNLPGSSTHGIFQATVLEWGAIAFSSLLWVSMSLNFLDSTYEWDHTVFVFLCQLISVSIMPSSFIYVVTNGRASFFLWLNNFPLYIYKPHILSMLICHHLVVSMSWLLCIML